MADYFETSALLLLFHADIACTKSQIDSAAAHMRRVYFLGLRDGIGVAIDAIPAAVLSAVGDPAHRPASTA